MTQLNHIFSQYQFDDSTSPREIIDFAMESLHALILPDYKYIKSRKALEMKVKDFIISITLQSNRHNEAGKYAEAMLHYKIVHSKIKTHNGVNESYLESSDIHWYELYEKSKFMNSFQDIAAHITQYFIPLVEKLLSSPNALVVEANSKENYKFSPYFFYRYGTQEQFEQAKQSYYSNLSEDRKQQFDEAVDKFRADRNSPIRIGEDWAYLTVLSWNDMM